MRSRSKDGATYGLKGRLAFVRPLMLLAGVLFLFLASPQAWASPEAPVLAASKAETESGRSGGEAEQARQAYENARKRLNIQTELPSYRQARSSRPLPRFSFFSVELARYVLIAAGLIIGYIIVKNLLNHLRKNSLQAEGPEINEAEADLTAVRMSQARDSADELAQAGDFTQAMHLLLLQSVSELRRRLDLSIASCLTSREILARTKLLPEAKAAFADIIGRVEVSYFGFYQPSWEDYQACRGSFESLKENLKPGPAAKASARLAGENQPLSGGAPA